MLLAGRAWKYGDNVNTDILFPGKYTYTVTERSEIARHALEDLDPTFVTDVQQGDVVVGGRHVWKTAPQVARSPRRHKGRWVS